MRFYKFIAMALTLAGVSMFLSTAWAKKSTTTETAATDSAEALTMEDTGLPSFDALYAKAKGLIESLQTARTQVNDANAQLVKVLALPEGTPVADALNDLKSKAEGKITVAMNGTTPSLSVADGVPQNVTDAVEAVNVLAKACTSAVTTITAAMTDAKALGGEAAALPAKVPSEVKAAGLKVTQVPAVTKKVGANNKVVATLPSSMDALVKSCQETLSTITSVFAG